MLHDLQFNLDKVNPSNKKGSHTFFFNSVDECSNFEEIKNQNNSNDLLKKKRKPSKDQDDDVNDSNFKIKINNLKLKNKNVETLNKISSALSLQKHLLKDRKFKKLGEGSYKFFSERKR